MNTLYQGDNLTISIDSEVDLIVTSPPYNLGIDYQSADDNLDYGKYLKFTKSYLTRFYESLKPDGRLCLNIPLDKNKGGQKSVGADITTIAKSVGFQYQSTIVWNEGNISKRTAWGSWMKASAPYVIAPVELIVIFYKEQWKKESGSGKSDIQRDEFIEWTNGLWTFPGENGKKYKYPAAFPFELPKRCIKLFSYVGDIVLDPFAGSGTTLDAAHTLGRDWIGIDVGQTAIDVIQDRLRQRHGLEYDRDYQIIRDLEA